MNHLISCILVITSLTFFGACSSTTTISKTTDKSNPEYYTELKSNQERLVALLTGNFVLRINNKEEGIEKTRFVNDNQDSILFLSIQVGAPNKDGYWIYNYQYMSHLPNNPFLESLVQIKQIDRDTFHLIYHKPAEPHPFEAIKSGDFAKDIQLKNLKQGQTKVYIQAENSKLHFLGSSSIQFRKIKNAGEGVTTAYIQEEIDLQPGRMSTIFLRYENPDDKEPMESSPNINILRRLDVAPWLSDKKGKKR